ncbi:hypothetical protein [Arenimonas alkanexedens]
MKMMTRAFGMLVVAAVAVGCDAGDGTSAATSSAGGTDAAPTTATKGAARERTGTIEIDGQSWTFVPDVQCRVYPGPVAYVAGHAANDETIEIVIDYNPGDGVIGASVESTDGTLFWEAGKDALTFEINGRRIKGEGDFTASSGGEIRTARGKFEIDCQ